MGKNYCAIKDCHNIPNKIGRFGKPVKLHELPKKKSLRSAWLRAISRKNYNPKRAQVCSDHFPDGNGRTWKHQVPTLFLPQKKQKDVNRRLSLNISKREATCLNTTLEMDVPTNHLTFHSYSKTSDPNGVATNDMAEEDKKEEKHQSIVIRSVDTCTEVDRPEITVEDICNNDEKVQFYTGLPDWATYNALFECLMQHGADKLVLDNDKCSQTHNQGVKRKLRLEDEFLMVCMRLRLGLLLRDLEYRFKISAGRLSRIFHAWINHMCKCLQTIVFLPKLESMNTPKCFEHFRDTRIVLDCTEIFVQTPSSLCTQSQTYSNYKGHNTFKALVGIDKIGAVVFVSRLWGGSVSDTKITRESGLYLFLEDGDAVMVDKGFIGIKDDLQQKGVKLYCPPFLTKSQFTKKEVEMTRRIASARIHVERKMEQIKNFRILQGVLPLSLCDIVDEIFFVCAALTNLLPALVK